MESDWICKEVVGTTVCVNNYLGTRVALFPASIEIVSPKDRLKNRVDVIKDFDKVAGRDNSKVNLFLDK